MCWSFNCFVVLNNVHRLKHGAYFFLKSLQRNGVVLCGVGNANEQGRGIRSNAHEKGSCVMGNVSRQGRKCECCVRATCVQAGVLTAKDYALVATFCLGAHRKARTLPGTFCAKIHA
ncbi:hypothetical protein HMPREF3190_00409 [Umbribacter vaginalis]|nr:hypothetical protein HMPREF3190_00409 [Coriobacteriales bacterium DNF00809]